VLTRAGAVPGPKNQIIRIQDALGKPWPKGPMVKSQVVPVSITPVVAEATPVAEAAAVAA
jgi:large subunit ribosomal protein L3